MIHVLAIDLPVGPYRYSTVYGTVLAFPNMRSFNKSKFQKVPPIRPTSYFIFEYQVLYSHQLKSSLEMIDLKLVFGSRYGLFYEPVYDQI